MSAPEPDILDLGYLRSQLDGDEALERELLSLLLQQCDALLPLLSRDGEGATRRDAAHSLRGASAGLGAWRLAAVAEAIEAGREPVVAIEQAVREVRDAIGRVR